MRSKNRTAPATTRSSETSVEDEVAHLRDLDLRGLRARWQSIFQRSPPMADRLKSLDRKRTDLTPGTLLVREWDHKSHRVMVLADGFAWNGQSYDSLTKVESATIAHAQKKSPLLTPPRSGSRSTKAGCQPLTFSARNGIFGCGDTASEIAARDNGRPQRPEEVGIDSGSPGTNGLSKPGGKLAGLAPGLEPGTH